MTRLPNPSGDTLALISMLSTSPILDFPRELAHALIELPLIVEGADQHMTAFSAERVVAVVVYNPPHHRIVLRIHP